MSHELDWQDGASDESNVSPTPLPGAHDELEAGIAAVFAAIRNGGADPDTDAATDLEGAIGDDGVTFALLGELNRLWQQAPH